MEPPTKAFASLFSLLLCIRKFEQGFRRFPIALDVPLDQSKDELKES